MSLSLLNDVIITRIFINSNKDNRKYNNLDFQEVEDDIPNWN